MRNSWYTDVGEKIKKYAKFIGITATILSIIALLIFIIQFMRLASIDSFNFEVFKEYDVYFFTSLVLAIFSIPNSWILYGFGQLIENLQYIEKNTSSKKIKNSKEEIDEQMPNF